MYIPLESLTPRFHSLLNYIPNSDRQEALRMARKRSDHSVFIPSHDLIFDPMSSTVRGGYGVVRVGQHGQHGKVALKHLGVCMSLKLVDKPSLPL